MLRCCCCRWLLYAACCGLLVAAAVLISAIVAVLRLLLLGAGLVLACAVLAQLIERERLAAALDSRGVAVACDTRAAQGGHERVWSVGWADRPQCHLVGAMGQQDSSQRMSGKRLAAAAACGGAPSVLPWSAAVPLSSSDATEPPPGTLSRLQFDVWVWRHNKQT
jgi:hypothetical protein